MNLNFSFSIDVSFSSHLSFSVHLLELMHNTDGPTQNCNDHQHHSNEHQYTSSKHQYCSKFRHNSESPTTFYAISSVARVAGAGETPLCVSALCIIMTVVITSLTLIDIYMG